MKSIPSVPFRAVLAIATGLLAGTTAQPVVGAPQAKHVILFIGDGMQLEHEIAASVYLTGKEGQMSWPHGTYLAQQDYDALKNGTAGYLFVERTAGVDGGIALMAAADSAIAQGKPLFGLFGGAGGNFESPEPADAPGAPSVMRGSTENPWLKDATLAALKLLSRNPEGSFLMIEQGDIGWANHDNDFKRMMGTCYDLHLAVIAALEFVAQPGDDMDWSNTLLIVTSDHANSYMRLTRNGKGKTLLRKGDLPTQVGTHHYPHGEVTCGTGSHTDELVTLHAIGAGNKLFNQYTGLWYPGTRILDNTHIYEVLAEAVGVE